jgi:putative peptidoglycan lipid II flippase
VRQTAEIVKIYSLVLLFSGFNKVIVPAFYAIQNTWLPALTSSLSLVFHIAMASLFVKTLGLQGLIISMLISSIANTIFLLFSLSKWVDKLDYYLLLKEIIKFIPSLFGMTAVIYFLFPQLELYLKEYFSGNMPTIFALSLVILLSIVIYFIINKVFGVRYADQILTLLNKRRVR